jgi:hypothetical protein
MARPQPALILFDDERLKLRSWASRATVKLKAIDVTAALNTLPSQPLFSLGMKLGTPVSTTALNLTRDLIPSLISRTAS